MTKLVWNDPGTRFYETGVSRGVLYPFGAPAGVAWTGLISVQEETFGGDVVPLHYDAIKYKDFVENEEFKATLEAYQAPHEFAQCDGQLELVQGLFVTRQPRVTFGLSYKTQLGNDLDGVDHGYKLHLVYNATAAPAQRDNRTIAETPSPNVLTWTIETVPPHSGIYKPVAHIFVNSTRTTLAKITALEDILYGTLSTNPRLPTQDEVIAILE